MLDTDFAKGLLMKSVGLIAICFVFGCGYSATNVKVVGQIKQIGTNTPILCPIWKQADVSLGIMRNGSGSMSTHDMRLTISDEQEVALKQAADTGKIVTFICDIKRFAFCTNKYVVKSIQIQK